MALVDGVFELKPQLRKCATRLVEEMYILVLADSFQHVVRSVIAPTIPRVVGLEESKSKRHKRIRPTKKILGPIKRTKQESPPTERTKVTENVGDGIRNEDLESLLSPRKTRSSSKTDKGGADLRLELVSKDRNKKEDLKTKDQE